MDFDYFIPGPERQLYVAKKKSFDEFYLSTMK